MIREKLIEKNIGRLTSFRPRSHEVSRIDAVFGYAITLLVVSLEVPKIFNDLVETMRGLV